MHVRFTVTLPFRSLARNSAPGVAFPYIGGELASGTTLATGPHGKRGATRGGIGSFRSAIREEELMKAISRVLGALGVAAVLLAGSPMVGLASNPQPVDINTASVEELTALPGIGPAKAEAIVAERSQRQFESVGDLTRVRGIGERTLEELGPRIVVRRTKKGDTAAK